jgi:hypothetical protein
VRFGGAGDQYPVLVLNEFPGNPDDLVGRFAGPENYFRKTSAQTSMGIELRKTKVDDGSRLERVEHFIASHCAGPKSFQQFDGFSRCHGRQSATV